MPDTMLLQSGFFSVLPWYAWVAIVAILAAMFQRIVASMHQHEERMALIKQGKDPNVIRDDDEDE